MVERCVVFAHSKAVATNAGRVLGTGLALCDRAAELARSGWSALVEQSRGHTSKAMAGHLIARVTESPQHTVHGVLTHRPLLVEVTREHQQAIACARLELTDNLDCLARKWYDMRRAHLHALRRKCATPPCPNRSPP